IIFFSSRRRHTRSKRDWSSDVCSSDLTSGRCCIEYVFLTVDYASHFVQPTIARVTALAESAKRAYRENRTYTNGGSSTKGANRCHKCRWSPCGSRSRCRSYLCSSGGRRGSSCRRSSRTYGRYFGSSSGSSFRTAQYQNRLIG